MALHGKQVAKVSVWHEVVSIHFQLPHHLTLFFLFSFLFSFILRLISMFITVRVSLVFVVCEVGERKNKGINDEVMY